MYQNYKEVLSQETQDMREIWALISCHPGLSLRSIARTLDFTLYKTRILVDNLLAIGTLIKEDGKSGTLRATVPLLSIRKKVADDKF